MNGEVESLIEKGKEKGFSNQRFWPIFRRWFFHELEFLEGN